MAKRKVKDYTPDPSNANIGTERGLRALDDSLSKYGAGRSILVDKNGYVIAGNKTLERAADLGMDDVIEVETDGHQIVAVKRTDLDLLTDDKARLLAYADNRVAQLDLEWDAERLLADLNAGIDIRGLWGDDAHLEELLRSITGDDPTPDAGAQIDRAAELQETWQVQPGDLWTIGKHKLLCGDSTKADDVARVMGDDKPLLMVTDPPYGVEYDATWREEYDDFQRHSVGKVVNDDRANWLEAYQLFQGDVAYVWHASLRCVPVGHDLIEAGFELRYQLIWRKQHFVFSRGHYHWQHEPCWYVVRKGTTANFVGTRDQSTIWDIPNLNRPSGSNSEEVTGHGTQKPVECMARPIRNHDAAIVYDPFGGSGTTMVACEQLGRQCRMIEISEKYCAVILQRMSDIGLTPQRVS